MSSFIRHERRTGLGTLIAARRPYFGCRIALQQPGRSRAAGGVHLGRLGRASCLPPGPPSVARWRGGEEVAGSCCCGVYSARCTAVAATAKGPSRFPSRPVAPPMGLEMGALGPISANVRHKAAPRGPRRSPPALGALWGHAPPVWCRADAHNTPDWTHDSTTGWWRSWRLGVCGSGPGGF